MARKLATAKSTDPTVRSPRQRELVAAAARLFSERGYHAVAINDISGALGLSGPAIYRHFRSKEQLLVAVLDECIISHLEDVREIVTASLDPAETLQAIVVNHAEFVFAQRGNITTWRTDFGSLPPDDRSRLRYLQRLYTEEWVRTLGRLRPELERDELHALCTAAIALLQAPTESSSQLGEDVHKALLVSMALRALSAELGTSRTGTSLLQAALQPV